MVYGGADRKEMVPALMRIIAAQQNDKSPGGVCVCPRYPGRVSVSQYVKLGQDRKETLTNQDRGH